MVRRVTRGVGAVWFQNECYRFLPAANYENPGAQASLRESPHSVKHVVLATNYLLDKQDQTN